MKLQPVSAVSGTRLTMPVGLIPGEGIGPELIGICRRLLERMAECRGWELEFSECGPVGLQAREALGADLPSGAEGFVAGVFARGGAVLAGAGGGRFVFELRRRFQLDWKLNPVRRLRGAGSHPYPFDILIVRDNKEGLYQGEVVTEEQTEGAVVRHTLTTRLATVRALVGRAARLAADRSGRLAVVAKESGIPGPSRLWRQAGEEAAAAHGVELRVLEVDFAAYQMVRRPEEFDVIAVPNAFGDILADLGGLLMGSRGATFGASFNPEGLGVFQTNHGAAYDLAGTGTANPAGQMLATALMLREAFGQEEAAVAIETAVQNAWCAGFRTADMDPSAAHPCATEAFAAAVEERLDRALA